MYIVSFCDRSCPFVHLVFVYIISDPWAIGGGICGKWASILYSSNKVSFLPVDCSKGAADWLCLRVRYIL